MSEAVRLSPAQKRALRRAVGRPAGNVCPLGPRIDDHPISSQLLLDALERKGMIAYPMPASEPMRGGPVITEAGRAAIAALEQAAAA